MGQAGEKHLNCKINFRPQECEFKTNNRKGLNRHNTIKHQHKTVNICKETTVNVDKEVNNKSDNDDDE